MMAEFQAIEPWLARKPMDFTRPTLKNRDRRLIFSQFYRSERG